MKSYGYISSSDLRYVTSEFHLRSLWSEEFLEEGNAIFMVESSFINMWTKEKHKDKNQRTLRFFYSKYPINIISVDNNGIQNIEPSDEFMVESIIPARSSDEFGMIGLDGSVNKGQRGQDYVDLVKKLNYESVNDCLAKGCSLFSIFKNELYLQIPLNRHTIVKKWLAQRPNHFRVSIDLTDSQGNTKTSKNFKSVPDALIYLNSLNIWGDA